MIQSLLALAALFLAGLAAEAAPQISVQAAIEIEEQESITLGDIATFEGFSANRTQELKSVRLTDAPQVGEQRVFTSQALAQIFRNYIGSDEAGEKVYFSIPNRIVISRKAMKLNEVSVKQSIIEQLKNICSSCEFKIDRIAVPLVNSLTAQSKWSVRIRNELPKGTFSYPLELKNESGSQTYWVNGSISISKRALVAKRNINIGERIAVGDFADELRDITFLHDSIADQADLVGSVAARGIRAEQVIGRTFLKKEPAFKFGDVVKVISGNESWQISIDGVAQQSAAVGETARVKIPRTQKLLSGVVVDKGVIEVR